MFEEMSEGTLPNGRRPDIALAIFPHLKEFIAIDLRRQPVSVQLIAAADIFRPDYYREVEREFASALREGAEHPFAHIMSIAGQADEIVRGIAMNAILEHLGVDFSDEDALPEVVVFVIAGPILAAPIDQLVSGFTDMLADRADPADTERWADLLRNLAQQEADSHPVTPETLGETLTREVMDPYLLWQNRN